MVILFIKQTKNSFMKDSLHGKRLLVLGGSTWKEAIHEFAQEQGIYLIAAAPYHVGIFDVADEAHLLDVTDSNVMIPFIKEHQIDGVYMGGSEPVIEAACQYLEKLNYPCYCNKLQWESLHNKKLFKQLCIDNGLPVVPMYNVTAENLDDKSKTLPYPVITKPADGCGSAGFTVCHNADELKEGFARAVQSSASGSVVTERYVKNDAVVVFYTFCNGEVIFSGLEDKYPVQIETGKSFVGGFFVFNSRYTELFRTRYEKKVAAMFKSLGIQQGSAWIEVFRQDDEFFFNEVGFRYGGSVSIYPVDYLFNINQVANDITYSLTSKGQAYGHRSLSSNAVSRKKYYGVYPLYAKSGTISSIEGFSQIRQWEGVIFATHTKSVGYKVLNSGDFSHNVGLVHFVFDTPGECEQIISAIHNTLTFRNEAGEELLLNCFNYKSIKLE